jgi:predicted nucleic acid-binding protein
MIILDTNIVSELMKTSPDMRVLDWSKTLGAQTVTTTSICCAEIYAGLSVLQDGKRKQSLMAVFGLVLETVLSEVLPFDEKSAKIYGGLYAAQRARGAPTPQNDLMIAAITKAQNATLITRNTKDFQSCGIEVVNPFMG